MVMAEVPDRTHDFRINRYLCVEEAYRLLGDAWWGGKNRGLKRVDHNYTGSDDGSGFVEVFVPLDKIQPNEAGDRYDGTVVPERLAAYVNEDIRTPVHLLYGERSQRKGRPFAFVMDGGHRVSAARLRQATHILAIMKTSDLDRLIAQTNSIQNTNQLPVAEDVRPQASKRRP